MSDPIVGSFSSSVTIDGTTIDIYTHDNHDVNRRSPSNDVALNSNSLSGTIHTSNTPWLRVVYWDTSLLTPSSVVSPGMDWAAGDSVISKLPYNPHNPGSGIANLVDGGLAVGVAYDIGLCPTLESYMGYEDVHVTANVPGPVADNHSSSGDFEVAMQGYRYNGLTHFNHATGRLEAYGLLATEKYNTPAEWGTNGGAFGTPFDPALHPFYPQISALAYIASQLHPSGADPNITVDNYSRYPKQDHWTLEYFVPMSGNFWISHFDTELSSAPLAASVPTAPSVDTSEYVGFTIPSIINGKHGYNLCFRTRVRVVVNDDHGVVMSDSRYHFPENVDTTFTSTPIGLNSGAFSKTNLFGIIAPRHHVSNNTEYASLMEARVFMTAFNPLAIQTTGKRILSTYSPGSNNALLISPDDNVVVAMLDSSPPEVTGKRYLDPIISGEMRGGDVGGVEYVRGICSNNAFRITVGDSSVGSPATLYHYAAGGEAINVSELNYTNSTNQGVFGVILTGAYSRSRTTYLIGGGRYTIS